MIEPGQEYVACSPTRSMPGDHLIRIRVVDSPITTAGRYGYGKVDVETVLPDGRGVRRRAIEASQLHDTPTTRDGKPRRTGYALTKENRPVPRMAAPGLT